MYLCEVHRQKPDGLVHLHSYLVRTLRHTSRDLRHSWCCVHVCQRKQSSSLSFPPSLTVPTLIFSRQTRPANECPRANVPSKYSAVSRAMPTSRGHCQRAPTLESENARPFYCKESRKYRISKDRKPIGSLLASYESSDAQAF